MSGTIERAQRWIQTLRYHRPRQLVDRLSTIVRRRIEARKPIASWQVDASASVRNPTPLATIAAARLHSLASSPPSPSGSVTLLNKTVVCGRPVEWRSSEVASQSHLWRFQLQYFEWLLQRKKSSLCDDSTLWDEINHWIATFGDSPLRAGPDAFHPFCISRRIPAWLCLLVLAPPAPQIQHAVLRSVANQAEFLYQHLELDLGGNHLLENGRALMFAGLSVESLRAEAWVQRATTLFQSEIPVQILEHGEHFERSPRYHEEMRELFNEVSLLNSECNPPLSAQFRSLEMRMRAFSEAIRHPDGDIPLFGDSTLSPEHSGPRTESATAPLGGVQSSRTGPYWTFRNAGDFVILDAGPVGADELPAHAHSDLLTIEASVVGNRLIVDSGVHDYEAGDLRKYCRSSTAHNVLEIDGENQCDVWSKFRMGRRGWPGELQSGRCLFGDWGAAVHNAYRHRSVPTVGRFISCAHDQWLIVDWSLGTGTHRMVTRLHFHPDVIVRQADRRLLEFNCGGKTGFLGTIGTGELHLSHGWYCPRLGEQRNNCVVEIRCSQMLPAVLGWRLTWVRPATVMTAAFSGSRIHISDQHQTPVVITIDADSGRVVDPTVEDRPA